jgi:hypothetical protein
MNKYKAPVTKNPKKDKICATKFVLMHYNEDAHKFPIQAIGIFDTREQAELIANDEDVMNYYGGTLDDGDFYVIEIPFNPTLEGFKEFHLI